jgi:CysZ protein
MLAAAFHALRDMFTPPLRRVLLKSIGLALLLVVLIGIALQRLFSWLATSGATWAQASYGGIPEGVWTAIVWIVSILATLGVVTGAIFLMPAVTAFVGSFFVDEVADYVERTDYPADPPGRAVALTGALIEGIKTALLALVVYVFALPFVIFAGIGFLILFLANAWLLSREYFELAAMRFHPLAEAKALRRRHAGYLFAAGLIIAAVVSIPIVNLATPLFAMTFMVHLHKRLAGPRNELIEPQRATSPANR